MDSRVAAELIPPVYEDFDPSSEMVHEKDGGVTIILDLPGFRKDHLKVQLTTSKILRISGSRQVEVNKWRKFQKEFPVAPDHDTQKISAKFEGGMLYTRIPKLIPPPVVKKEEKHDTKLPAPPPAITPKEPADQPPPQKGSVQEQVTNEKTTQKDDSTKQTDPQIVKEEPKAAKEKNSEPTDSEKKAKKSPDLDESKTRSIAGDKRQDDKAKKSPEEKPRGFDDIKNKSTEEKTSDLDDSKKKSIAGEDDRTKATEKREKESSGTADGSGKSRGENYKETEVDHASKMKKYRRMFNLTLIVISAIALGIYFTNFIKSWRSGN